MPRPKKPATELTNEEALKKLFPPDARKVARREAKKARKSEEKSATKKDST